MNIETTLANLKELIEFAELYRWDMPITAAEDLKQAYELITELQSEADMWKKQFLLKESEMNRLYKALRTAQDRLNEVLKMLSKINWSDFRNAEAAVKGIATQLATEFYTEEKE